MRVARKISLVCVACFALECPAYATTYPWSSFDTDWREAYAAFECAALAARTAADWPFRGEATRLVEFGYEFMKDNPSKGTLVVPVEFVDDGVFAAFIDARANDFWAGMIFASALSETDRFLHEDMSPQVEVAQDEKSAHWTKVAESEFHRRNCSFIGLR